MSEQRPAEGFTGGHNHVTIDLQPYEVHIPTPGGRLVPVDLRRRRADVVRRLLALEVSPCTLIALLPEWSELINRIAAEVDAT